MSFPFAYSDSETALLAPGLQAPPLVCWQQCIDDNPAELIHVRDPACRRAIVWSLEHATLSLHNAAYDTAVICAQWPDLTPLVFAAYDADRVVCTIAAQKLLDIASGRFKVISRQGGYGLDQVARRLKTDIELNKDDFWRTRYGLLYGVDVKDWPADAVSYALLDARAQREVHRAQLAYSAQKQYPLTDVYRQSRKALWAHLMACRGIMVDPARVDQYIADVREALDEDRETCAAAGLVRWERTKWVKKTAPAQEHMVKVCQETEEVDLPITETGEKVLREMLQLGDREPIPAGATWQLWEKHKSYVKLDEDSCQLYGDELLEAFQRYGTSTTQIARAERLKVAARRGVPIQARFQSLGADTGRTTCSQGDGKKTTGPVRPSALGFQLQNPAKDKKVKRKDGTVAVRKGTRELFVARPGYYFCSTDYESMELCGVAQVCIWAVGQSKLAQVINEGRDAHAELAATLAGIPKEEAYARKDEKHPLHKEFVDQYRQTAKVGNFGFWGAMGPAKMVLAARKQYGVILGKDYKDPERPVTKEMALKAAKDLRDAWFATWPEARLYFQWAQRQMEQRGSGDRKSRTVAIEQYVSGRLRGGCWFTQLCNTMFQGLCADIAGVACWQITREMYAEPRSPLYGSRLVNMLHDEPFSELLIERAHEAAYRQAQIQIDVGKFFAPDVKWGSEPALMTRWYKQAKAVFDANGRLIPWEPEAPKQKEAKAA